MFRVNPRNARRTAIVAVSLGIALAGCGGSASSSEDGGASQLDRFGRVPSGAPGAISVEAGNAVPLGIEPRRVVSRLGPPVVPLHRKDPHYRCMFYDLIGQPPSVQLQFCFAGGKLKLVASYVSEG